MEGDWQGLQQEFVAQATSLSDRETPATPPQNLQTPNAEQEEKNIRRALRLIKAGEPSRAARTLVPSDPAPRTPATTAALEALHPPQKEPLPAWVHDFQPATALDILTGVYLHTLARAPRLSKPGPTGWTFEHIRDLFPGEEEDSGRLQLAAFLPHIVTGKIPEGVARALASSRLRALAKPNSDGVRPVAIGEVWMRLASSAIATHMPGGLAPVPARGRCGWRV